MCKVHRTLFAQHLRLLAVVLLTLLAGAVDASAATLTWNRNPETDIVRYTVHWGTASGNLPNVVDVGNVTTWSFTPPAPTTTYYFAVQAHNSSGLTSPLSAEVFLVGTVIPPPLPPGSRTDFNNDGYADLLWQHQGDGGLVAWTMTGTLRSGASWLYPQRSSDLNWKVVAVADFNQDRKPDLLWQHQQDGRLIAWLMQGLNLGSAVFLNPSGVADANWRIVGTGDFNGDAKPDLLWQHKVDGGLVMWLMDGLNSTSALWLVPSGVPDQSWRVAAIGDFNGDGKHDLLWRHEANGWLVVWMMNGQNMVSAEWVNPNAVTDKDWRVAAAKDFNNDGWTDILWQHKVTGKLNVWLMNRLNLLSAPFLNPDSVTDLSWKVVGAQ